jgi:hypothetical protein
MIHDILRKISSIHEQFAALGFNKNFLTPLAGLVETGDAGPVRKQIYFDRDRVKFSVKMSSFMNFGS